MNQVEKIDSLAAQIHIRIKCLAHASQAGLGLVTQAFMHHHFKAMTALNDGKHT
jgi:hypothetical protein